MKSEEKCNKSNSRTARYKFAEPMEEKVLLPPKSKELEGVSQTSKAEESSEGELEYR